MLGDFPNQDKQKHILDVKRTGLISPTTEQDRAGTLSHCLNNAHTEESNTPFV